MKTTTIMFGLLTALAASYSQAAHLERPARPVRPTPPKMTLPEMATPAFAFSGGGSLGAFEVGVADYLTTKGKLSPKIFVGTSTGAITAAKLAEGPAALGQLKDLYLKMNGFADFYIPRPGFKKLQWNAAVLEDLQRREPNGVLSNGIIESLNMSVKADETLKETVKNIVEVLSAPSLFDNSPLTKSLRTNLSAAKVSSSGNTLRIATVDANTGSLYFFTQNGDLLKDYDESVSEGKFSIQDGVTASAAIPVAFPPKALSDHMFIDGGIREMVPVKKAIQLGANKIYVIHASKPKDELSEGLPRNPGLLAVASRSLDLALDEISANDVPRNETLKIQRFGERPSRFGSATMLRKPESRDMNAIPASVEIKEFRPEISLHNSLYFDKGLSAIAMDYGYMVAGDNTLLGHVDATANAITELRYKAWKLEYELMTNYTSEDDPTVFPILLVKGRQYTASGEKVPLRGLGCDIEVANPVRELKRQLRVLVQERRTRNLALSGNADNWWMQFEAHSPFWEYHKYDFWKNNPWDGGPCGRDFVKQCDPRGSSC